MQRIRTRSFAEADLASVLDLCRAEGWPSYPSDPARALRALTAPGIATVVAECEASVVGFATGGGDGEIQGYLINLAVSANHRRLGIARQLVSALFEQLGVGRLDLLSTDSAVDFYRSFTHRILPGYRIYPGKEP